MICLLKGYHGSEPSKDIEYGIGIVGSNVVKPEEPTEDVPVASQEKKYLNKTVVREENQVLNGRVYKLVTVSSGETFQLTPEEYNIAVK